LRPRYRNTVRITRAAPGGLGAGAESLETPMAPSLVVGTTPHARPRGDRPTAARVRKGGGGRPSGVM
jgi:hypothetical protein